MKAETIISMMSVGVAFLAVIVGPWIQARTTRRQTDAALAAASRQITDPMRQAWIDRLRDLIAELINLGLHYKVAGFEDRTDREYMELTLLQHKVMLMLNLGEEDHRRLYAAIGSMVEGLNRGRVGDEQVEQSYEVINVLAPTVLKREWNRVKDPIRLPGRDSSSA
jgi:hypothetical protein